MQTRTITALFVAALAALLALPVTAAVEPGSDAGFTVSAVMPENQLNTSAAYFDLQVEPGWEQELFVRVENPNTYPITVTVETVTASTNRNGIINYSVPGYLDPTLPVSFDQITRVPQPEIEVPAGTAQDVPVALAVPEVGFTGTLLGSIRVVKQPEEWELDSDAGVINQYSYAIAVCMTQDLESQSEPEFLLGDITAELVNHKAAIVVGIRNPTPNLIRGMQAQATIRQQGQSQPVIQKAQEVVDMAPHSIFPMTLIDQEGYGFAAGDYTAEVTVKYGGETWSFLQDFTVEEQLARELNSSAVNQQQNRAVSDPSGPGLWLAIGLGAGLCVILLRIGAVKRQMR